VGSIHIHQYLPARKPSALLVACLLILSAVSLLAPARATDCSTTLVFRPTDDATIRPDMPTTNLGTSSTLVADASPVRDFLLRFSVTGVGSCQVTSAKLRLFQVDSSDRGGDFHTTASNWSEAIVTWNNAPAAGPKTIASLGSVSTGKWFEVDLTSVVPGDSIVSLRVSSPSSDGAYYSSKEGANPPQLVLTLGPPASSNSHAPIFIDGNSGFTYANGVRSGSGTASDPYVISNWDIDLCQPGAGCGGSGIFVRNTDANFVIRNVRVRSSGSINTFSYYDADVYLYNVADGRVENSTLSDGRSGITVEGSKYVTLSGNNLSVQPIYMSSGGGGETQVAGPCMSIHSSTSIVVSRNTLSPCVNGMESFGTTGMVVSGNKFVQDGVYGLFLEGYGAASTVGALIEINQFGPGTDRGIEINDGANVTQTTISGNIFSGQGIDLHPPTIADCCPSNTMVYGLAQLSSNTITTDNLVNGKPIYYFEGCSGTSINGIPVGQLIVVNCMNFQASNLQIGGVIEGIVLSNVHGATIINDTLSNISRFGVLAFNSDHVTVTGNNITAGNGIQFYVSSNMLVYHNNFLGGGDFAGGAYQGMDYKGSYDSWDYGYPSGGNFWWNYNATDNCGGPQQEVCTGPDGIGDTPFGLDRYPLMKPYPVQTNPHVGFDFSLDTPSPSSLSMAQGGTSPSSWIAAWLVNAPSSGFVTFTASGLPSGVTASFTRNPCPFLGDVQGTPGCFVSVSLSATITSVVGTRNVTISAESEGISHSTSISLTVTIAPLAASFTVSNPVTSGRVASFTASASGGSPPYSFSWAFGDGGSATGSSATHTYSTGGSYTVTLTTQDSASRTIVVSKVVTVASPAPNALAISNDGKVFSYQNGVFTLIAQPVATPLRQVAWNPNGSYALIVGDSGVVLKYDGSQLSTIPTGVTTNLYALAWKPDGSYAMTAGSGGVLFKYDGASMTRLQNPFTNSIRSISWNPAGTQALMVGSSGTMLLYQPNGQITKISSGTTEYLYSAGWSPNGQYALAAGGNGVIVRYDGTSVQALNTTGLYSSMIVIHSISWIPSGTSALLVGDSGLVLTYDGSVLTRVTSPAASNLYSLSWLGTTAYISGGSGSSLTYTGGVLSILANNTSTSLRDLAWKPS